MDCSGKCFGNSCGDHFTGRDLMNKRGSSIALALICALFGFMVAIQFRAKPPLAANLQQQRAEELSVLLRAAEADRDELNNQVTNLRQRVAETMEAQSRVTGLQKQLSQVMIMAGLTRVTGPGITVDIAEPPAVPKTAGQPAPYAPVLEESDVKKVINELQAAGAEAISINGQRIIAQTSVQGTGKVLIVNGVRVEKPIKIQAIGEAQTLATGLKMHGGVVDVFKFRGFDVKVKIEQEVTLPAFSGSFKMEFAKPVASSK